jgi:hypothetical protein
MRTALFLLLLHVLTSWSGKTSSCYLLREYSRLMTSPWRRTSEPLVQDLVSPTITSMQGTRTLYLRTYLLTYSMQQSPSWEANRSSASQEIPPNFMEPEGSLPHSQVPATCPYPEPDQSCPSPHPHPHPTSWRSILPSNFLQSVRP